MTCKNKINTAIFLALATMPLLKVSAQVYTVKNAKITLFSSAPLEDIRAVSIKGTAVFASQKRELVVQVPIRSFEFDKKLMQEHFNENYMESDKYPYARFRGVVESAIDLSKDGVYPINLEGILSVHGVDKKRRIPAQINVQGGHIRINCGFLVSCADHQVKIPSLMFTKIAESIRITAEGEFIQLKK